MTVDEVRAALAALERALGESIFVTRIIIDPDGREVGRIVRGPFQRTRETGNERGGEK